MKNLQINSLLCVLLSATASLSILHCATAEGEQDFGEGANGVNRVIRTNDGYTGIRTTVSNLSFSMPTNEAGLYEVVDAAGNPILDTNNNAALDLEVQPFPVGNNAAGNPRRPQGNKPSTYLGGQFRPAVSLGNDARNRPVRTTVDAGLQYEPTTLNNTAAGWSVFFYLHNVGYLNAAGDSFRRDRIVISPRVWDSTAPADLRGMPYRLPGTSIDGTMTIDARASGSAGFTFSKIGTIYANPGRDELPIGDQTRWDVSQNQRVAPWGNAAEPPIRVFDTNLYNQGNVRRVTAMTRDNPHSSELDGSQVVANWVGCEVRPTNGDFRTWVGGDVNQGRTGYDAPGAGNMAWDKRFQGNPTALSKTIVQFSPNFAANELLRSQGGTGDARYAAENVTLNLGTLTRPIGEAVQ